MPASITGMLRAFSRSTMVSMVLAGDRRVEAAQHVVGAELHDHPVGAVGHGPVEPVEPAGGGVAGDARIGDLHLVALGLQGPLQHGREGGLLRQAVAGAQAVAEGHEADRLALRLGCRKGGDHGGKAASTAAHAKMIVMNGPDWRFIDRLPISLTGTRTGLQFQVSNRSGERACRTRPSRCTMSI